MKSRWSIPALGAFFVLIAVVISGCGSSIPSNSVASVAGNPISTRAVNHWMYVYAKGQAAQTPGAPVIVPNDPPQFTNCITAARAAVPTLKKTATKTVRSECKQLFTSYLSQVMGYLITGYWYQAEAHKQGINVTDAQVQKALAKAKKSQFKTAAQYAAYLKQSGETNADVTYQIRISQVETKLLAKHPTKVTSADISAYYDKHKSQFGSPERRNMRIVLAKSASQAAAAKKALQSGQSWTVVAKKYSIDPSTKNKGGQLTDVTKGQQDAALSKAAFAASANKLVGPVKGQYGYYLIEVTKVIPATQKSLAQSSALIKQTLTSQKQQAAETAIQNQAKKDWLSKTKCRSDYSVSQCSGYKAPKTSTTSTGAATAPATSSTSSASSSASSTASSSSSTTTTTSSK